MSQVFSPKYFFKPALFMFCAGFLFLFFAAKTYAATYYWVGGTTNSNTSNPDNWDTVAGACANSGDVALPGAGDTVRFVSNCLNDATVNAALSVTNFYMDFGYTGTVTNSSSISATTAYIDGGILNVPAGTTISDTNGYIGNAAGSDGTVNVSGAGARWTNSGILYVGNSGTGALTIENGGVVSNTDGHIARLAGSSGAIVVDGAGSTWTSSGMLRIVTSGAGTLTIQNGGTVNNTNNVAIGYNTGVNSSVIVDGAGSTWTSSSYIIVGKNGNGSLTIQNGGVLNSVGGTIANTGSVSSVTVDGLGSIWNVGGELDVGNYGNGALNIQNGGEVNSTTGILGNLLAVSIGTVVIDGDGSNWTATGNISLGKNGTGTITLSNDAVLNVGSGSGTVTVAELAGSTGTLNIGADDTLDLVEAGTITAGLGTAAFPPLQPTGLTNVDNSDTSIDWDWDDLATATGYKIYRTSDDMLLDTISSATSQWTQNSLTPDTDYGIYIRGTNAQGEGYSSLGISIRSDDRNINTHRIKATSTENSIKITWKTDYKTESTVRYGINRNLKEKKKDDDKTKNHKIVLKNLAPNTKYYFRVKDKDTFDIEDSSKIHSIMTKSASNSNKTASTTAIKSVAISYPGNYNPKVCSYIVKSGDTLWSIAKEVYGDSTAYPIIIEKNKDRYSNIESSLSIGQELGFGC